MLGILNQIIIISLHTSEYKIHNTTKLACSNSNKLMITCDGYLWPCCHIISAYYYRNMFVNDLKIPELYLYENQFESILQSDKWKTSMTNILQSGVCNEKLCDMK